MPLIDIGMLDAIRDGRIKLRGDIASFAREVVDFRQSPAVRFYAVILAVILATGFRPASASLLPDARSVLERNGSTARQRPSDGGVRPFSFAAPIPSALGQLRPDRRRGARHCRRGRARGAGRLIARVIAR